MDLIDLSTQNPWWSNKDSILEDEKVKEVLAKKEKLVVNLEDENLILIGSRQLGKTTSLKYDIYKKIIREGIKPQNIFYYSFDLIADYNFIIEILTAFCAQNGEKKYIYLDEISFVKEWQRAIKFFLDSTISKNSRIYITSSSSINLRKELFPGRNIKIMEYKPVDFRTFVMSFGSSEIVSFLKSNFVADLEKIPEKVGKATVYFDELLKLFQIYIYSGGYPKVIFEFIEGRKITDTTYDVYFNAFLSDLGKTNKRIDIAESVLQGILISYSSKLSFSSIAKSQKVGSHVTVNEYLSVLKDLFIVYELFASIGDNGKTLSFRKERKIYFTDPFLYRLFSYKLNVIDREAESKVVEGVVLDHLIRMTGFSLINGVNNRLFYYNAKKEIDFILDKSAIEVKWQNAPNSSDFPKSDFKFKFLLTKKTLDLKGEIKLIPVPLFLAFIDAS
jgi:hypothetical protein